MKELITFKDLPLSNDLIPNLWETAKTYDLNVGYNPNTHLVSLYNNVSHEKLFHNDYVYDSSQSQTMIKHFEVAAINIQDRFKSIAPLEIGSNSGIFIKHFPRKNTVAVEPCSNFAHLTTRMKITTYDEYWGDEVVDKILKNHGQRDMIYSANTISHIQNLDECFNNVYKCLHKDGVFIVECPSFLHLLKGNAFDQFYHEHQSYFSCLSLNILLKKHNLSVFDIEFYPVHGGTYRYFITKDNYYKLEENVVAAINEEREYGLDNYETLKSKMKIMENNMSDIKKTLLDIKDKEKTVIGYGASAKFTQVTNMCDINDELICCAIDTTPNKQNKYLPKSNIPVLPYKKETLLEADYCFLGAWNYKDEIIEKEKEFLEKGGKFITHIPKIEIIEKKVIKEPIENDINNG
jgi:methylation protein EvaC